METLRLGTFFWLQCQCSVLADYSDVDDKIRETNRRKTRRPPSGVCSRHFRYTYYVHSHKTASSAPNYPFFESAVHYWPYITAARRALSRTYFFRVFLHLAVHFELSAFERGCDIGRGNEQDTHAVEMEVNKGPVNNGG